MFRKNPQPKPAANIKSSERRNILLTVCSTYGIPRDALLKDQELALVPSTIKQSVFQNALGLKGTIYYDSDEKPIWYKTRDSQLMPCIYTLWAAAYFLPIILTNDMVIQKLQNGSNLMLPGCIPPFDVRATRGALVAVASYKSPTVAMAIGHCSLNLTQFDDVQGRTGIAVTIIHTAGDELCKLFEGDVERPDELSTLVPSKGEADRENENIEAETAKQESVSAADTNQEEADDLVAQTNDELVDIPVEDIDNFFVRLFIQSVKTNTIETPISTSKLMSEYVLKNLPRMDSRFASIKKTSWKKSAKFVKAVEKMGYVTIKGKGDDVSIISFTIPADTLANFVTHRKIEHGKSEETNGKGAVDKLNVVTLFKPTKHAREFFSAIDAQWEALFTKEEIKSLVGEHVTKAKLANLKNRLQVNLDSALSSATNSKESVMSRSEIVPKMIKSSFLPHFAILRPGEELSLSTKVLKGEPPKIKILTVTVLGRKKTTTVLNFEHFYLKPHNLAEDLRNLCSGSTSISQSIHNANVTEVMVQGPHGPVIIEYFKAKGVPPAFIEFDDKSKGKKKKATH